jgi:hypothetical protein
MHENPGRIAQRESVPFTRERSKVRSLVRPPEFRLAPSPHEQPSEHFGLYFSAGRMKAQVKRPKKRPIRMKRLSILAALTCLAVQSTHAQQSEYGDMTDVQVKAIQMTSLATLAGSHGNCPSFHVIETALSEEWYAAHIFVDRPNFRNAMSLAMKGPLEQMKKDQAEFCRGAWQQLGPGGLYRRQLLEAN